MDFECHAAMILLRTRCGDPAFLWVAFDCILRCFLGDAAPVSFVLRRRCRRLIAWQEYLLEARQLILVRTTTIECSVPGTRRSNSQANRLDIGDEAVHSWYRFVLSFPPHLVRDYLERFGVTSGCVLDPFCGTGTTLVECKKQGISSVGIEANTMAAFASAVKTNWTPDPDGLRQQASTIGDAALTELDREGIIDDPILIPNDSGRSDLRGLSAEKEELLLAGSISPLPLHKALVLSDAIKAWASPGYSGHLRLALAQCLVSRASNLHFGPEVGVGVIKDDAPVIRPWLEAVQRMASDLGACSPETQSTPSRVHGADSREAARILEPESVDTVITSPPYPNEKDYTRTTRLESVLLGFIESKRQLRGLKRTLVRSNTRSAYTDDTDDHWVADHPGINRIAEEIEARRIELGKTSGFERMYARVTRLYFGGMARHLADLRTVLKPGAQLAYVVGDQASYLRVMIRTGELLADIAGSLGYEVVGIDLFRTRLATATRAQLREEVVVLRWPR